MTENRSLAARIVPWLLASMVGIVALITAVLFIFAAVMGIAFMIA